MAVIAEENVHDLDKKDPGLVQGREKQSEFTYGEVKVCIVEEMRHPDVGASRQAKDCPSPEPHFQTLSPYVTVPIWISLSGGLIILNKWIFTTKGFAFPAFLTAYHMVVAIIGTNALRYTTNLLQEAEKPLPAEACRLVLVQILLRDIKMDPLVSLYHYAPVCLVSIAFVLPFLEGLRPFYALPNLGWHVLLVNGLMAFGLNVSSVLLIRSSGAVVLSLSGVLKDIVLISLSVVLLGSAFTLQHMFGYGLALVGLIMFKERERVAGWLGSLRSRRSRRSR
ncbi:hypothetical protein JCM24511_10170 [Saitozyma sp. JCM 24511]|nr:hypothetical protein JCM24511_10170 [Saitozyma sp. JCM 24511]